MNGRYADRNSTMAQVRTGVRSTRERRSLTEGHTQVGATSYCTFFLAWSAPPESESDDEDETDPDESSSMSRG